ncbi:MAG TPA: hypothetical protein VGJ66_02265 [Pyrinomonadaceae bacterium]|jgi:hypothetical protein
MSKTIKKYGRRYSIAIALFACLGLAASAMFLSTDSSSAAGKKKVDTPILTFISATPTSIDLQVCAPDAGQSPTGLPAGFSIQWMTQADYDANGGWPVNSDDPSNPDSFCKASFSGNAFNSRYDLLPGECVTVRIGDLLFDNGASTDCPGPLVCDTAYVFRAFGHANSSLNRSDWSANVSGSTLPCGGGNQGGCTFTQGYWKTHGPSTCFTGNNTDQWPVTSLTLGTVNYTDVELCSILQTPSGGNGLIALAHQLIAAKLNIANGADSSAIAGTIASADALIGGLVVPPVGSGYLSPSSTSSLTTALDNYNTGGTGPGHCP